MTHAEATALRPRIYIAGAITKGCRSTNLYMFHQAHEDLMRCGFAPFNPGPTMQLPFAWDGQFSHEDWLDCCFPWVAAAEAVYRLPGESAGADAEVRFAQSRGIPVFNEFFELTDWRKNEYLREQRRDDNGKGRSWNEFARWLLRGGESAFGGERQTSPADPRAGM